MNTLLSATAPHAVTMDARQFFLEQHGFTRGLIDNFVLAGLSDEQLRMHPAVGGQNALAFLMWRAARSEDVIVNAWLAESPQVFDQSDWQKRLDVGSRYVGTGLTEQESADLAARVELGALRAYSVAVSERTTAVVQAFSDEALRQIVGEERLRVATPDGAYGNPRALWLDQFYSGHTCAWHLALLNVHLAEHLVGEALAVRGQLGFPLGL